MKIIFFANPFKMNEILEERLDQSENDFNYISKIFYMAKKNKSHLKPTDLRKYRPIACLSALNQPIAK